MSRPPGRPPLNPSDRSIEIGLSMPSKQLAAAELQAKQYGLTVQDWLRRLVKEQELKRNK